MNNKNDILQDFLKKWEHLPKQGSKEWLNQRKTTIGGSQIATVLGINKYEKVKDLIKSKTEMSVFKKAAPLWFGSLMERCVEIYVEKKYNMKTYETGSLPCEFNENLSYSPDGLCIINKINLTSLFSKNDFQKIKNTSIHKDFDNENLLVLLEFKSPFMRRPIKNQIPDYYVPQPLLGMEIIPIAEVSIFVECVFRFCSYNDLLSDKYSRYHWDRERYTNTAIAYSAISLYYDPNNHSQELVTLLDDIYSYNQMTSNHEYNISNITDKKIINSIMEDIVDKKNIKVIYHDNYLNDESEYTSSQNDNYYFDKYNNMIKFKNDIKNIKNEIEESGNIFIGRLFYKMLDVNINPVFKENLLTPNVLDNVKSIINRIQIINNEENIAQKKILLNSFNLK